MGPTLEKAGAVADTSELFMRAKKLLDLAGTPRKLDVDTRNRPLATWHPSRERGSLQPLVRKLMTTLLEDYPTLLDEADLRNLMDPDYCKTSMGIQISDLAGMAISGTSRKSVNLTVPLERIPTFK